jgi:hypothetical protein
MAGHWTVNYRPEFFTFLAPNVNSNDLAERLQFTSTRDAPSTAATENNCSSRCHYRVPTMLAKALPHIHAPEAPLLHIHFD